MQVGKSRNSRKQSGLFPANDDKFIGIKIADKILERERKNKQGLFPLKNVKFRGLIQVSAQFHYYFHKTITLHGH